MTTGQKVSFEFCGTNYIFTVNQAALEGQESSKGLERGFITADTYIVFETSPNSGIKVFSFYFKKLSLSFWDLFLFELLICKVLLAIWYYNIMIVLIFSSWMIQIINQREAASSSIFRQKEFNLQKLGIGGLSEEFTDIFRRAFASRVFPPHVTNK